MNDIEQRGFGMGEPPAEPGPHPDTEVGVVVRAHGDEVEWLLSGRVLVLGVVQLDAGAPADSACLARPGLCEPPGAALGGVGGRPGGDLLSPLALECSAVPT